MLVLSGVNLVYRVMFIQIAVKQGNQLQMNVYKESSPLKETSSCSWQLHEKTVTEKLAVLKDELTAQVGCRAGLYSH